MTVRGVTEFNAILTPTLRSVDGGPLAEADGAPNIEAAEQLGITGILHAHPETTVEALARLIPDRTTPTLQKEHP
jgi:hypothetical protein